MKRTPNGFTYTDAFVRSAREAYTRLSYLRAHGDCPPGVKGVQEALLDVLDLTEADLDSHEVRL